MKFASLFRPRKIPEKFRKSWEAIYFSEIFFKAPEFESPVHKSCKEIRVEEKEETLAGEADIFQDELLPMPWSQSAGLQDFSTILY